MKAILAIVIGAMLLTLGISSTAPASFAQVQQQQQQTQQSNTQSQTTTTQSNTENVNQNDNESQCSDIYIDKNSLSIQNPWCEEGFDLDISNQQYTFVKNFRSDGSMRMDFRGHDTPSPVIAGFIRVQAEDCATIPNEEIAGQLNGGPHTSNGVPGDTNAPNSWWADTMDIGIDFEGQDSRLRLEPTHPEISDPIASDEDELPLSEDLCVTNNNQNRVGVQYFKTNLDTDCDDEIDSIGLAAYVNLVGSGNNWDLVYKRIFTLEEIEDPNASLNGIDDKIKSAIVPYVETIGHPEARQQTIRIDQQSLSEWQSTTNPPYKHITLKNAEATNESC
jgi:hypothetical protein